MDKRTEDLMLQLECARYAIQDLAKLLWPVGDKYNELVNLPETLHQTAQLTEEEEALLENIDKEREEFRLALKVLDEHYLSNWSSAIKDLADKVNPTHGIDW